jgi:hypothetical protein
MQQFIRRNALLATGLNVVINAVIPAAIMWNDPAVNGLTAAPNLFTLLLPAVFISALATTIATFATLPGRLAGRGWLPAALLHGVGIALLFAGPVAGLLLAARAAGLGHFVLAKPMALVLSALVGGATGALSSFVAVRRAATFFHLPLSAATPA